MNASPTPARQWVPAYAALAVIWGSSFLFIKVADRQLAPPYVALGRVALGAAVLLLLLAFTRQALPRGLRLWGHLAVLALFTNAVPFMLFAYAELRISSVLAGIWNAVTPLPTLIFTLLALPQERPTRQRLIGLALGFVGVLIVLGVWRGTGGGSLTGQLMCLLAVTCYGIGFVYLRRFLTGHGHSGVAISAGQLLIATAQLLVLAPLLAGAPPDPATLTADVWGSMVALGALGTGLAFAMNFHVVKVAGATTASTVTYLTPVVATVAGVVLLDEGLAWYQPVGAAVVLGGIAVSQWAPSQAKRADPVASRIMRPGGLDTTARQ